jgi:hypothetical protein
MIKGTACFMLKKIELQLSIDIQYLEQNIKKFGFACMDI